MSAAEHFDKYGADGFVSDPLLILLDLLALFRKIRFLFAPRRPPPLPTSCFAVAPGSFTDEAQSRPSLNVKRHHVRRRAGVVPRIDREHQWPETDHTGH